MAKRKSAVMNQNEVNSFILTEKPLESPKDIDAFLESLADKFMAELDRCLTCKGHLR